MPAVPDSVTRWGLQTFRRLPLRVRRTLVRLGTPNFTVGAVCVLRRDDEVLLLCQRHTGRWALPGGLLQRGEEPAEAVRREVAEEIGLTVEVGRPACTVVDG